MSEIVYTHVNKRRDHIADMVESRTLADRKVTIFQSHNKVAVVGSSLVVGVPRLKDGSRSDKRYYYWRSTNSFGFRRNRAGNVIPYQCTRPWDATVGVHWRHQQARDPFDALVDIPESDWQEEWQHAYRRAVWESFDIKTITDLFPMLDEFGMEKYESIPYTLHAPFRTDDWTEFANRAFGKTRTTPRLIAAVKNTEPYHIAYARNFRGLVDNDLLVEYLERNRSFSDVLEAEFRPYTPDFRAGILAASQETRDSLIKNDPSDEDISRRIQNVCVLSIVTDRKSYQARMFKDNPRALNKFRQTPLTWREVNRW